MMARRLHQRAHKGRDLRVHGAEEHEPEPELAGEPAAGIFQSPMSSNLFESEASASGVTAL